MKTIYVTNPDGPWIYQLDDKIIEEIDAWKMINAGEADLNDSGIIDWYALSNNLSVIF